MLYRYIRGNLKVIYLIVKYVGMDGIAYIRICKGQGNFLYMPSSLIVLLEKMLRIRKILM